MRLTTDEARIVAEALNDAKYDYANHDRFHDKEDRLKIINRLQELEDRLRAAGDDGRRKGRRSYSKNNFDDVIARYCKL